MSKITGNKITYIVVSGLVTIAILAFTVMALIPYKADAMVCINNGSNYNPNCQSSDLFTYGSTTNTSPAAKINPTPAIYSLIPNTANTGSNPSTITVTGKNFVPGAILRWNGSDRSTTYVDSTHITFVTNGDDLSYPGSFPITVYNPAPSSGVSNTVFFQVIPAPVYTGGTTSNTNNTNGSTSSTVNGSNLGASAASSGVGFLPKNVIQWIIFFILVLVAVVLFRKIFINDTTPMKHA